MSLNYPHQYPRPQFVRKHWQNLNGLWDFAFDDAKQGRKQEWFRSSFAQGVKKQKILVPFSYESQASGIGDETLHECVWYQRTFDLEADQLKNDKLIILHLDGSDYETTVWVNARHVGSCHGGQHRHSFDISDQVQTGTNTLTIEVRDDFDPEKVRGKQRWLGENYQCWYTQTTGLWKTVWLETLNRSSIQNIEMAGDFDHDQLLLEVKIQGARERQKLRARVSFDDKVVEEKIIILQSKPYPSGIARLKFGLNLRDVRVSPWQIHTWSPEDPKLYDLEIELTEKGATLDHVSSYYGHRKITWDNGRFCLNDRPYFMKLILDQGYWKESLLTCPGDEAILHDIHYMKAAGFNGLRKHQKVEDERFIYHCDREGLLVWSEIAATYVYTTEAAQRFTQEWMHIVQQYRNFPSIVVWTPFNESWGVSKIARHNQEQALTRGIYELTHALDKTRPVISNDGWEHTKTDLLTLHDYEEDGEAFFNRYFDKERIVYNDLHMTNSKYAFAEGHVYDNQPIILSEYGGIAFQTEGSEWGYGRNVSDLDAFVDRLGKLHDAITACGYFQGVCYTQLTDVQQEVNGLLYMDHSIKIPPEIMRSLMDRLQEPLEQ